MIKLPVSLKSVTEAVKEVKKQSGQEVRLAIVGPAGSGKSLLGAWLLSRNARIDARTLKSLAVVSADSDQGAVVTAIAEAASANVVLVVLDATATDYQEEALLVQSLGHLNKPVLVVLNKADLVRDGSDLRHKVADFFAIPISRVLLVSAKTGEGVLDTLVPRLVDLAKDADVALAKKFPALRHAVAEKAVHRTANENGLIGVLVFLPGADMPILTLNQIRMVMKIASIYDQEIGFERAKEILAVLAGGLVFRTAARNLVSLVPVVGWGVKGGIAYGGTVAVGRAAMKYFESKQQAVSSEQ